MRIYHTENRWYCMDSLKMYAILLQLFLSTVTVNCLQSNENGLLRFEKKDYPSATQSEAELYRGDSFVELNDKMVYTATTKETMLGKTIYSNILARLHLSKNIISMKSTGNYEGSTKTYIDTADQNTNQNIIDAAGFESSETGPEISVHNLGLPPHNSDKRKLKNYLQNLNRRKRTARRTRPYIWNKDEEGKVNNYLRGHISTLTSNRKKNSLKKSSGNNSLLSNMRHFLIKRADTSNGSFETTYDNNNTETSNHVPNNRTILSHLAASREINSVNGQIERQIRGKIPRPTCNIKVFRKSKTFFHSRLISREPDLIQFKLSFCNDTKIRLHFNDNVFQAKYWFWTYNSTSGPYRFLSWDLDYGILSFHLLEAKTINVPYVCIEIEPRYRAGKCDFTFGEQNTSQAIASALMPLVNITEGEDYYKFPANYFCHLSTRQEYFGTFHYWAAIYLNYPINYVCYKCCTVSLNYDNDAFDTECKDKKTSMSGFQTWTVTKRLPYVLGILLLLYFPVMFFNITAWLAKDENISNGVVMFEMVDDLECLDYLDENWLFADGNSPFSLGDLLSFKTFGLDRHPVLVSRLRRLLFVFSFPIFIYLQVAMYSEGMGLWKDKIRVKDLVKVGTPMGFLSILADADDRSRVFVPALGGPVGVVVIYYMLSLLFIALPRSVKQVVEDGLPSSNLVFKSPLFFGTNKIIKMSMINVKSYHLIPGYTKAVTLMKCRFYILFTRAFWNALWNIQIERILAFICLTNARFCTMIIIFGAILPFYVLLCAIETACCIVFHGIPFCSFVSIMINGGVKSLRYLRNQSVCLFAIFKYRVTAFVGVSFVIVLFMIYIYVISLAFITIFGFIFQIITYCFVAIIIYPSVSFGYLFFFIVLLYYFIKLIRNFGDGYTELLATTVDISRHLSENNTTLSVHDGELSVSNVRTENIVDVRINGKLLHVSPNVLESLRTGTPITKVKERDGTYGIPKRLFDFMVEKHRPVHQQVLILIFKAAIMITFVILTLTISANYVTGPNTEISEVMHVIFIVAVGAVPQLVQAVLSRSDTILGREIEEREIKRLLIEFWNTESEMAHVRTLYVREQYQDY